MVNAAVVFPVSEPGVALVLKSHDPTALLNDTPLTPPVEVVPRKFAPAAAALAPLTDSAAPVDVVRTSLTVRLVAAEPATNAVVAVVDTDTPRITMSAALAVTGPCS